MQAGSQGFESPCLQPRKLSGLSRRSLGEGGHLFGLLHFSRELRLGKPVYEAILLCLHFAKRSGSAAVLYWVNRRSADASRKSQLWPHHSHVQMEAMAVEDVHRVIRSEPGSSARAVSEIRFRSCIRKATFVICRSLRSWSLRSRRREERRLSRRSLGEGGHPLFSICDLRLPI